MARALLHAAAVTVVALLLTATASSATASPRPDVTTPWSAGPAGTTAAALPKAPPVFRALTKKPNPPRLPTKPHDQKGPTKPNEPTKRDEPTKPEKPAEPEEPRTPNEPPVVTTPAVTTAPAAIPVDQPIVPTTPSPLVTGAPVPPKSMTPGACPIPRVAAALRLPHRVRQGGRLTVTVTIRNRGRTVARNVVARYAIPPGLAVTRLPRGTRVQRGSVVIRVGTLRSGRSHAVRAVLHLGTHAAGQRRHRVAVSARCTPTRATAVTSRVTSRPRPVQPPVTG